MSQKTSTRTERSRMVTGMFRDRDSAEAAYRSVSDRGYSKDDINVMMTDETRKKHFGDEDRHLDINLGSKSLEGAAVGAGIGGALGALLAGIAAVGTLAIPGVGIIAAGPIAAALAGLGAGAATGGLVGALVGAGIPEDRAKMYEKGVQEGGIVMGVEPRSDEDAQYIENEWKRHKGEHVYL